MPDKHDDAADTSISSPTHSSATMAAAVASTGTAASASKSQRGHAKNKGHTKVADAFHHIFLHVSEKLVPVDEKSYLMELVLELCGIPWFMPHTQRTPHLYHAVLPLLRYEDITPAMQLVAQRAVFQLKDLGWICGLLDVGLASYPNDSIGVVKQRARARSLSHAYVPRLSRDGSRWFWRCFVTLICFAHARPTFQVDERDTVMDLITKSLQILLVSAQKPKHAEHLSHLRKFWVEHGSESQRRAALTCCTKVAGLRVDLESRAQAQATNAASKEAGVKNFEFGLGRGFSRLLHRCLSVVGELLSMNTAQGKPAGVGGFTYFLCTRFGFSFLDK